MTTGVLFALVAGLFWGIGFVAPLILADYPPVMLAIGRYLAFGLIAIVLALRARAALAALSRADWIEATKLTLVGNFAYYFLLASAIQLAGGTVPTLIIGTLPVTIALVANWGGSEIAWRRLVPSLVLILAGLVLAKHVEIVRLVEEGVQGALADYWLGIVLAVLGCACWTWYPIRNARWLKRHTDKSSSLWNTAQGLVTLPIALAAFAVALGWYALVDPARYPVPFGAQPMLYLGLMLAIGIGSSWLGNSLWNAASRRLPTSLAGQLIVFETLAALGYAFLWKGEWPGLEVLAGIALLVAGVVVGVRAFSRQS